MTVICVLPFGQSLGSKRIIGGIEFKVLSLNVCKFEIAHDTEAKDN